MKKYLFIISAMCCIGAVAKESPQECAKIIDNMERLTCYDQLFKIDNPPAAQPETLTADPKKSEASVVSQPAPTKDPSMFGLEHTMADKTPEQIKATLSGSYKLWKKGMSVKLNNGQVWEVISSRKLYHAIDNPEVTIEKGAFGAFYMAIEGVNRRLKVKRLK